MRALRFALPAVLILSLACGLFGDPVPDAERGEYGAFTEHHKVWEPMDLPYYGGVVEVSTETYLEVTYDPDKASPKFLREQWAKAVKDSGWEARAESVLPNSGFTGTYDAPAGMATLFITPEGSIWIVSLSITPEAAGSDPDAP